MSDAILGTQFIRIVPDTSEVDSSKLQAIGKKAGKSVGDGVNAGLNTSASGNDPFAGLFARADKALNTFGESGSKSARQLRPILVAQAELAQLMEKGGPNAAKYAAQFAALNQRVAGAQKSFSVINDEIADQAYKLKEGQVAWQGWGETTNIVLGRFGALQKQIAAGGAAFVAGYAIGTTIARATGVDFSAQDQMLEHLQQSGRGAWSAIDDLGAVMINVSRINIDSNNFDEFARHVSEDANGAIAALAKLSQYVPGSGISGRLASGMSIAANQGFGMGAILSGFKGYSSEKDATSIADAFKNAQAAGIVGQRLWHDEVEKTSKSYSDMVANVQRIAPQLEGLALRQRELAQATQVAGQIAGFALGQNDFDTARQAILQQRADIEQRIVNLGSAGTRSDHDALDLELKQNEAAFRHVATQELGLQISAKQQAIDAAKARGALGLASTLTRQLTTLQLQVAATEKLPDANRGAISSAGALALRQLQMESAARAEAVVQAQLENAKLLQQDGLVRQLTVAYGNMEVVRLRANGENALADAMAMRNEIALARFDAAATGDAIAIKQLEMETAKVNNDADAYERLRREVELLGERRIAIEKQGGDSATTLYSVGTNPAAVAIRKKFYADLASEGRASAVDTARTMLSLNQQIVQIYQSRGYDVGSLLKSQADAEFQLQQSEQDRSIEFLKKSEEEKSKIRIGQAILQNQKLQEIDFEYGTSWQQRLDRQAAALGTSSSRMETAWQSAVQGFSQSADDFFFDVFKGRVSSLDDVFKGLIDSMLHAITKLLADQVTQRLILLLVQMFGGSSYQWGATAGSMTGSVAAGAIGAHADGGILGGSWTPFQAFAGGGIVNRPTLGLVGEGRYNEAVVPLPDGSRIPVQLLNRDVPVAPTPRVSSGGRDNDQRVKVEVSMEPGLIARVVATSSSAGYQRVADDVRSGGPLYHNLIFAAKRA